MDINAEGRNGWNALHIACYYRKTEIAEKLIKFHGADINCVSSKGWAPLHTVASKGYSDLAKLLLSEKQIKVNLNLPDIGTPLHQAVKKRQTKVFTLLCMSMADPRIKDNKGKSPADYATKKDFQKKLAFQEKQLSNFSTSEFELISSLNFQPPIPNILHGTVEKMSSYFVTYNERFIEFDPKTGYYRRFECKTDYPNRPIEVVPLTDIVDCKSLDSWYCSDGYFYFEIQYKTRQIFRCHSEEARRKWIEGIYKVVIFYKFWNSLINKNTKIFDYFDKFETEVEEITDKKEFNSFTKKLSPTASISEGTKKRRENGTFKNKKASFGLSMQELEEANNGINYSSFEILDLLGFGSFGKVFKVKLKGTNKVYAMKVISKRFLVQNMQLRYAISECNILKKLDHEFIVRMHFAFQTEEHLYMILDLCEGGDLSYYLNHSFLEEHEAKFYIAELILAIEYLHEKDIIYRDLKPENMLICSDGHIKLADFGLAKENVGGANLASSFCGSPAYLSPEMVKRQGAGKPADIYGIAACLFEMLTGLPPFYAESINQIYKNISKTQLIMPEGFSKPLQDLLRKMMSKDPKKRLGVQSFDEIKNHAFFSDIDWKKLQRKELEIPYNLFEIKEDIMFEGDDRDEAKVVI